MALYDGFSRVLEFNDTMTRGFVVCFCFYLKKKNNCFQKQWLFCLLDYLAQAHVDEFLFSITSNTLKVVDAFQLLGNLCYYTSLVLF